MPLWRKRPKAWTFGRVCSRSEKQMRASFFSRLIAAFLQRWCALPSFGGDWGDWGLQSSHRRGCGPTKGSESLIRDGGLQSSHRCGCGPIKGSESPILSPLSLRKRPLDIPKGGAFRAKRGKKAERATEDFRAERYGCGPTKGSQSTEVIAES